MWACGTSRNSCKIWLKVVLCDIVGYSVDFFCSAWRSWVGTGRSEYIWVPWIGRLPQKQSSRYRLGPPHYSKVIGPMLKTQFLSSHFNMFHVFSVECWLSWATCIRFHENQITRIFIPFLLYSVMYHFYTGRVGCRLMWSGRARVS